MGYLSFFQIILNVIRKDIKIVQITGKTIFVFL
jgi:hypothetical protein